MAKAAILMPYRDMCDLARPLVDQFSNLTPMCVEYTRTNQIGKRTLELEKQGCELIVARGVQAGIARLLPVVEIRITTQELAVLVTSLRDKLKSEYPRLGLIGFANMFGDTGNFNELFRVDLRCYFVSDSGELADAVERAVAEGCLGVIGGDIVCGSAKRWRLPFRFLAAGEESMRIALETADRVCYAIDLEKRNSAEMDTMLNNTFSGIVQVDAEGIVRRVNLPGCDLIGLPPGEIVGREITELLPDLDEKVLHSALWEGEESYAAMELRRKAVGNGQQAAPGALPARLYRKADL